LWSPRLAEILTAILFANAIFCASSLTLSGSVSPVIPTAATSSELAGVLLEQVMTIVTEFGVESRLKKEDHLQGLKNLQEV